MPEMPTGGRPADSGEQWVIPDTPAWNELYVLFESHSASTEDLVTLLYEGKGGATPKYMKEEVLAFSENQAKANWEYYVGSMWALELYIPAAIYNMAIGASENAFDGRVRESLRRVVRTYMARTAQTSFDSMRRAAASEFVAVSLDMTQKAARVRTNLGAISQSWYAPFFRRYGIFIGSLRLVAELKGKLGGGIGWAMQRAADSLKDQGVLQQLAGSNAGWMRSALISGTHASNQIANFARGTLTWPWRMTGGVAYGALRTAWEAAVSPINFAKGVRAGWGEPGAFEAAARQTSKFVFIEPWRGVVETARSSLAWFKNAIDVAMVNRGLAKQGVAAWDLLAQQQLKDFGPAAMRVVKPVAATIRDLWDSVSMPPGIVAPGTAAVSAGLASLATVATSAAGVALLSLAALGLGALVMRLVLNAVDGATEADVGAANWQGDPADADPLVDVAQEMANKLIPHLQEVVSIRATVAAGPKIPEDPTLWPGNMMARIERARSAISSLSGAGISGGAIIDVTRDNLLQRLSEIEQTVPVRVQAAVEIDPDIMRYAEMYATADALTAILEPRLEAYFGQMDGAEIETMTDDEFAAILSQILEEAMAANDPTIEDIAADAIGAFVRDVAVPVEEDAESPTGVAIVEETYPVVDEAIILIGILASEFHKTAPDLPTVDDALTTLEYIIPELPYELTDQAREILIGFAGARAMVTLLLDQSESRTVFGDTGTDTVGYPYIPPPTPEEIAGG